MLTLTITHCHRSKTSNDQGKLNEMVVNGMMVKETNTIGRKLLMSSGDTLQCLVFCQSIHPDLLPESFETRKEHHAAHNSQRSLSKCQNVRTFI